MILLDFNDFEQFVRTSMICQHFVDFKYFLQHVLGFYKLDTILHDFTNFIASYRIVVILQYLF